jgi:hypothetical protein
MGAFDDYQAPATRAPKSGGAFSDYQGAPPAPTVAPSTALNMGGLPDWLGKEGQGGSAIQSANEGVLPALRDYALAGADDLTFGAAQGWGPKNIGDMIARAHANLGPMDYVEQAGAYGLGPGKFNVGGKIADLMGGGRLARVGGSAAESATASGLGAVGHGDVDPMDVLKTMGTGLVVGAVTGALPGAGKPTPTSPSTADLSATEKNAWRQVENTPANVGAVNQALGDMRMNMTPGTRAKLGPLESGINTVEREASNTNALSAGDVASFQRALMDAARTSGQTKIAGDYGRALDTALGSRGKGVIDAAQQASLRTKTVGEIDNLLTNPARAPAAIPGLLAKNSDFYDKLHPDLAPMLSDVSQVGPSMMKNIGQRAVKAGTQAAVGYGAHALGLGPMESLASGVLTGAVLPEVSNRASASSVTATLLAARHLAATGQKLPSSAFAQPAGPLARGFGDLARQTGYGLGAGGSLP